MPSCKLIIRDEVNIKFEGLPVEIRRKLSRAFQYEIPYAKYQPAYKLGRWDGMVTLFGTGGNGYMNQLPKILGILETAGIEVAEVEDQRPHITLSFPTVAEDFWGDRCWPKGHVMEGQLIRMRDYQVDVINNFFKEPQGLQIVPTGGGKTIITATLSKVCERFGRSIVIVPNKSLVEQTEEDYVNCGLDVGVYYGDRKDLNKTHTICTWQSLSILDKKSKNQEHDILTLAEFLDNVKTVIIDEVHGAKAKALQSLLTQNLCNAPIRWGLTGTLPKEPYEYEVLYSSIGPVIGSLQAHELQDKGVLAGCHVNIMQLLDVREFKAYQDEVLYLTSDVDRLHYIAGMIEKIAQTGNTLVLVNRIESGKLLVNKIPDSVFISGVVKTKDRKGEYDEIRTSSNKVIVATFGVAAVGINVPRIFNLVLLEPGKSFVRVIQSIGRGIRKAQDKDHVEIYDITSTCKFAKRHLTERKKFYREASYPFTVEKIKW